MRCLVLIGTTLVAGIVGRSAAAQDARSELAADRAPRFLLASSPAPVRIDVSRTPVLLRRIAVDLRDASIEEALAAISQQAGLHFMYSKAIVPVDRTVRLRAEDITVAAALTEVLLGAEIDVLFSATGQAALVPRSPPPPKPARRLVGILAGRVTDVETNQAVRSAQVLVVNTQRGAITDDDGRYTITGIPAGPQQVRVLRVGYASVTQPVTIADGATATLDFSLTQSVVTFDEVVVTATGEEQRKRESGVAIGTISPDPTDLTVANNLPQLLNGRVAGVSVLQSGGTTGGGSTIRIRGANSVNLSNDPLLIIDGARVDASSFSHSFVIGEQAPGRVTDINPDEIENIEVIKGPAAAALYGTAAANGVIQITTKRGRSGKARWTAYAEAGGLYEVSDFPANYTQYGTLTAGPTPRPSIPGCTLITQVLGACTPDSLVSFNPLEVHSPFRDGTRQKYGLSVSGGGDQVTYFVSGDLEDEAGVFKVNDLDRVHLRANLSSQVTDLLDFSLSTAYLSSDLQLPDVGVLPNGPTLISNGLLGGFRDDPVTQGYIPLPPEKFFATESFQSVERFTGSINSTWRPLSWLSFNGTGGMDFVLRTDQRTVPPNVFTTFPDLRRGQRRSDQTQLYTYTANGSASGQFTLTPGLLSTTSLGVQYQEERATGTVASGKDLGAGVKSLNGTSSEFAVDEFTTDIRTIGGFAQQQLAWRDRLFFTAALRGDDNSNFGNDFGITYYPSVNASWVIGEEAWFPQTDVVSNLRLRAGWGRSGLRPNFRAARTFFSPITATVNGQDVPALAIGGSGNVSLKPEKVSELELGFEAGFFGDRIGLEFSYFDKESEDALISRTLPPSAGLAASRVENLGRVRNEGFEALIDAQILNRSQVQWSVQLSGSTLENELVDIGEEGVTTLTLGLIGDLQRHAEGYPLGGYWGRPILSAQDKDGDGIINPFAPCPAEATCELVLGEEEQFLGSSIPLRQASVSTSITLFNVARLYALADYRGRYKQANFTELLRCLSGLCLGANSTTAPPEEQARLAAVLLGSFSGAVEDASFWKLREVALTLMAPERWARRVGARGLSLTLSGRNLHTWTDYSGLDPEVSALGPLGGFLNLDIATQPQIRQFTARLTVDF